MIRTTARVNTRPLELFEDYLDNFNDHVAQAAEETRAGYEETIKRRLAEMPGPPKRPIQWTSEKQRQAFFASNGFGGGIPHIRTGDLARSWEVLLLADGGALVIRIQNTSPAAKYVYGPLGRNSNQAVRQQMHIDTGWLDARDVIDTFIVGMTNFFIDRVRQDIGEFGRVSGISQRAYTGV
jgi:hypothetical protein